MENVPHGWTCDISTNSSLLGRKAKAGPSTCSIRCRFKGAVLEFSTNLFKPRCFNPDMHHITLARNWQQKLKQGAPLWVKNGAGSEVRYNGAVCGHGGFGFELEVQCIRKAPNLKKTINLRARNKPLKNLRCTACLNHYHLSWLFWNGWTVVLNNCRLLNVSKSFIPRWARPSEVRTRPLGHCCGSALASTIYCCKKLTVTNCGST